MATGTAELFKSCIEDWETKALVSCLALDAGSLLLKNILYRDKGFIRARCLPFFISLCVVLKLPVQLWNTTLRNGCMLSGAQTKPVAGSLWASTIHLQTWSKSHLCLLTAEFRRASPYHGFSRWACVLVRAVSGCYQGLAHVGSAASLHLMY